VTSEPDPPVTVRAIGIKDRNRVTIGAQKWTCHDARGSGRDDLTDATLAEYGRRAGKDTWVLTRRGKPIAALVPISSDVDLESVALSHNPRFIEIINRARASYEREGGISLEEMRRKYAPARSASRRRKKR
jgi:antitoxin (DNA-binding transcriptional repressor) of toxin-antitoxin stability system